MIRTEPKSDYAYPVFNNSREGSNISWYILQ